MTVLIVGASGVIGRRLVENLCSSGVAVIPVVRKIESYSPPDSLEWSNIENGTKPFSTPIDTLILSFGNISTLVAESLQVIDRAIRFSVVLGCRHVIFLSSTRVYGSSSRSKFSDTTLADPDDAYGKMKYMSELRVIELCREGGIPCSILRLPVVLTEDFNNLNLRRLIMVARRLPVIGVWGRFMFRRSVLAVEDVCSLVRQCVIGVSNFEGVWLVGNGDTSLDFRVISLWAHAQDLEAELSTRAPLDWSESGLLVRYSLFALRSCRPQEVETNLLIFNQGWAPTFNTRQILSRAEIKFLP